MKKERIKKYRSMSLPNLKDMKTQLELSLMKSISFMKVGDGKTKLRSPRDLRKEIATVNLIIGEKKL